MSTDTFTLPRHALVDGDDTTTDIRSESPIGSDDHVVNRPRRTQRGAWPVLRSLLVDDSRQPASDQLMLLGPNGGPLWATRMITR